jgi:hypothetical protein
VRVDSKARKRRTYRGTAYTILAETLASLGPGLRGKAAGAGEGRGEEGRTEGRSGSTNNCVRLKTTSERGDLASSSRGGGGDREV